MISNYFDEKSTDYTSSDAIKFEFMSNQQLVGELHKPVIRKIEERKVYLFL